MRVALVTHQFFPAYHTGVERLALNLARQLGLMGHETFVVTSAQHAGTTAQPYAFEGVRVRPVQAGRADLARPWAHERALTPRLQETFEEERPDIVHVMHPMRLPQAFEVGSAMGIPVVAQVADFVYPCARITMIRRDGSLCLSAENGAACAASCGIGVGPDRVEWGRRALAAAAAVVSPCRSTTELHRRNGLDTSGWHHVPWGVDYAIHPRRLPAPETDRLTLGFIGSLLKHKGARVLLDAFAALPDGALELRIYGGSFHESSYERELRRAAGPDARIRFFGEYTHADLPAILADLDAVAIPSLWHENLPTTGLNAIASGVPLLVSDVGGLLELIDEYSCGFAFRVGDAAALADLLQALLDDPGRLAAVRKMIRLPPGVEEEAWRIAGIYDAVGSGAP